MQRIFSLITDSLTKHVLIKIPYPTIQRKQTNNQKLHYHDIPTNHSNFKDDDSVIGCFRDFTFIACTCCVE